MAMDGNAEAITIVAREVGEKAFGVVRQKLVWIDLGGTLRVCSPDHIPKGRSPPW
ncbi:MAG: hypothetical protein NTNFB01_27780 [Nitrospira sp.]